MRDRQRPEVVLDRTLSLHVVEMAKAEQLARRGSPSLADWLMWFRHSDEESIMQQIQTPAVHQAHQRLHALSQDWQAWTDAAQRESALSMETTLMAQAAEEKAEAMQEGIAIGRVAERRDILRQLLHIKFGDLPAPVEERLQTAELPQLAYWTERVLIAQTLQHVFNPPRPLPGGED